MSRNPTQQVYSDYIEHRVVTWLGGFRRKYTVFYKSRQYPEPIYELKCLVSNERSNK